MVKKLKTKNDDACLYLEIRFFWIFSKNEIGSFLFSFLRFSFFIWISFWSKLEIACHFRATITNWNVFLANHFSLSIFCQHFHLVKSTRRRWCCWWIRLQNFGCWRSKLRKNFFYSSLCQWYFLKSIQSNGNRIYYSTCWFES